MPQVQIEIDPKAAEHDALVDALQAELRAAQSLRVEALTMPAPGTLGVGSTVLGFVVEHHDALLAWVPALINAITMLLKTRGEKSKPVVIVVGEKKLSLPSSAETATKFVKGMAGETTAKKKTRQRGKPTSRRRPKRGAAR